MSIEMTVYADAKKAIETLEGLPEDIVSEYKEKVYALVSSFENREIDKDSFNWSINTMNDHLTRIKNSMVPVRNLLESEVIEMEKLYFALKNGNISGDEAIRLRSKLITSFNSREHDIFNITEFNDYLGGVDFYFHKLSIVAKLHINEESKSVAVISSSLPSTYNEVLDNFISAKELVNFLDYALYSIDIVGMNLGTVSEDSINFIQENATTVDFFVKEYRKSIPSISVYRKADKSESNKFINEYREQINQCIERIKKIKKFSLRYDRVKIEFNFNDVIEIKIDNVTILKIKIRTSEIEQMGLLSESDITNEELVDSKYINVNDLPESILEVYIGYQERIRKISIAQHIKKRRIADMFKKRPLR